jgi:hypothetical protein
VFPETRAEIERLETQIEQSQLIVAAHRSRSHPEIDSRRFKSEPMASVER